MLNAERPADPGATIDDLVRDGGSGAHPWARRLVADGSHRDLTDAAHALCMMHGAHPGLIEQAQARCDDPRLGDWLLDKAAGFAGERAFLAAVVAAAGPIPSTPGHARAEAAIAAQRHALETLAGSDRAGCAIGAAAALVLDWASVRPMLDTMASRLGSAVPPVAIRADVPDDARDHAVARARLFGAQQFLAQQRALWTLLEARSAARATGLAGA